MSTVVEAKVADYPDLVKRNGGVINTNHSEYVRAKLRNVQANRLNKLEADVCEMGTKLGDILSLLSKLVDKT